MKKKLQLDNDIEFNIPADVPRDPALLTPLYFGDDAPEVEGNRPAFIPSKKMAAQPRKKKVAQSTTGSQLQFNFKFTTDEARALKYCLQVDGKKITKSQFIDMCKLRFELSHTSGDGSFDELDRQFPHVITEIQIKPDMELQRQVDELTERVKNLTAHLNQCLAQLEAHKLMITGHDSKIAYIPHLANEVRTNRRMIEQTIALPTIHVTKQLKGE